MKSYISNKGVKYEVHFHKQKQKFGILKIRPHWKWGAWIKGSFSTKESPAICRLCKLARNYRWTESTYTNLASYHAPTPISQNPSFDPNRI